MKKYEKTCIGDDTSFNCSLVAPAENNPIASFAPVCSSNVNSVATTTITASRFSFTTETTSVGMSRNEQRYSILDQGLSSRVTFQDCNSSVDENLLKTPHDSSIFLSSPYGEEAPIAKEMTRDFNHFTRTSTEPPQHIEGLYNSSLNNGLFHGQTQTFDRPLPTTTTSNPLRSDTRYGHRWTSTDEMNINQSSQPMLTSSSNPQDTSSAYSLKGFKLPDIRLSKFDGNALEWNN